MNASKPAATLGSRSEPAGAGTTSVLPPNTRALPTTAFAHWTEHTRLLHGRDRDLVPAVLLTNPNTAFFHQFPSPVTRKFMFIWTEEKSK